MLVPDRGLLIPEWVPDDIATKARELHQAHAECPIARAVIERLTTDPRMRRVWDELAKQRREKHQRTGEPHHKLAERFASIGQDKAIAGLFEFAVTMGRGTLMLPPPDQPDRPYEALAKKLRGLAKEQGRDRVSQIIAKRLDAEADAIERITVAAYNPPEAIASEIAGWLQSVFGSPMYGTTAIMASVITGCDITDRKVRTWVGHAHHTLPENK
jgi:hypothetical protein